MGGTTFHMHGTVGYSQATSSHCPHPVEEEEAQSGEDTCLRPHSPSARLELTPQASWPRTWPFAFLWALSFKRISNPTWAHCSPYLHLRFPPLSEGESAGTCPPTSLPHSPPRAQYSWSRPPSAIQPRLGPNPVIIPQAGFSRSPFLS